MSSVVVSSFFFGWRFIRTREISVKSEGSITALWWIGGIDAVFVVAAVICLGLALFAVAGGIFQLP